MESFLQLVASGIATGVVFGSLGLAFVLVFQATRTLNLAQGEIAALGTFGAWSLLQAGLPYWVVFVLMTSASFVGGFVIHRVFVRPLDGKSHFSVIVVTLALLVGITTGTYSSIFVASMLLASWHIGELKWLWPFRDRGLAPAQTS